MNNSYIVINDIKYVFKYENKSTKIYKEINNELISLTDDEHNMITSILNSNKGTRYYKKIDSIIARNKNISDDKKQSIFPYLKWLEGIIPDGCKKIFYNNLETVKIEFNLDNNLSHISNKDIEDDSYSYFDVYDNTLHISKKFIVDAFKRAKYLDEVNIDYLEQDYGAEFLHELIHMASSYKKEKEFFIGFDYYCKDNDDSSLENRGLTEGLTEFISSEKFKGTKYSGRFVSYFKEVQFAKQLMLILGKDVMYESFFRGDGIFPLEFELNKLGISYDETYALFRNIENNFTVNTLNDVDRTKYNTYNSFDYNIKEQNFLANAQDILLTALEQKLYILEQEGNIEEIYNILEEYKDSIITYNSLDSVGINSNIYAGLDDNAMRYNKIARYFTEKRTR